MLVVVVVGPLVVVVLVVVGFVLRVWPMDPLWVFRFPLWGWGIGHRGQPLGLHYVVGRVKVKVSCSGDLRTPAYQ